jgi:hypothetical protein
LYEKNTIESKTLEYTARNVSWIVASRCNRIENELIINTGPNFGTFLYFQYVKRIKINELNKKYFSYYKKIRSSMGADVVAQTGKGIDKVASRVWTDKRFLH